MSIPFVLHEMTSAEVRDALPHIELAIIPTGATEQHGPNLTTEVDTRLALEVAKRVAANVHPRAIVCAPLGFGLSHEHLRLPGTISLELETFLAVLRDIVRSLKRMGIQRFLILNGHGAEQKFFIPVVVWKLREELDVDIAGIPMHWNIAWDVVESERKTEIFGHGCEIETSLALHLAPDTVRTEALARGEVRGFPYKFLQIGGAPAAAVPFYFDELTSNGVTGDGTLATAATGERLARAIVDRLTEFAVDFLAKAPGADAPSSSD